MTGDTTWFIAGLILISMFSIYAPRYAGVIVALIVFVLAIRASKMNLLSAGLS